MASSGKPLHNTMVEAVYVGSLGRKLISTGETNFPFRHVTQQYQLNNFGVHESGMCPAAGCLRGFHWRAGPQPGRSDPDWLSRPEFNSFLQTLATVFPTAIEFQLTVDKRFSKGFALRAAYTWAKTIDLTSGFRSRSSDVHRSSRLPPGPRASPISMCRNALSSAVFGNFPSIARVENGILKKIARGWQFNGIATFPEGQPVQRCSPITIPASRTRTPTCLVPTSSARFNTGIRETRQQVFPVNNPVINRTRNCISSDAADTNGNVTGAFWFNPTAYDCVNVRSSRLATCRAIFFVVQASTTTIFRSLRKPTSRSPSHLSSARNSSTLSTTFSS